MVENRFHPRLVVRLRAEYRTSGSTEWHSTTIHDLSASGAALLTSTRLCPETLVVIRFRLPESAWQQPFIEVESLVLRSERLSAVGGNVQYRAACHFLNLFGPEYELVRRYVFERTRRTQTRSS